MRIEAGCVRSPGLLWHEGAFARIVGARSDGYVPIVVEVIFLDFGVCGAEEL